MAQIWLVGCWVDSRKHNPRAPMVPVTSTRFFIHPPTPFLCCLSGRLLSALVTVETISHFAHKGVVTEAPSLPGKTLDLSPTTLYLPLQHFRLDTVVPQEPLWCAFRPFGTPCGNILSVITPRSRMSTPMSGSRNLRFDHHGMMIESEIP